MSWALNLSHSELDTFSKDIQSQLKRERKNSTWVQSETFGSRLKLNIKQQEFQKNKFNVYPGKKYSQKKCTWSCAELPEHLTPAFIYHFSCIALAISSPLHQYIICAQRKEERASYSVYAASGERSQMTDNSNKWATGQQWVMKSYQQSIIIESLKCTSSPGKQHSSLTSLCVSLKQCSSKAAGRWLRGLKKHVLWPHNTNTQQYMFSLVCLIKVKDATFLSSEPRGTRTELLSNMLMWLHHVELRKQYDWRHSLSTVCQPERPTVPALTWSERPAGSISILITESSWISLHQNDSIRN